MYSVTLNAVILFLVTDSVSTKRPLRKRSFVSNFGTSVPFEKPQPGAKFGSASEVGIQTAGGMSLRRPGKALIFPRRVKRVVVGEDGEDEEQVERGSEAPRAYDRDGPPTDYGIEFL